MASQSNVGAMPSPEVHWSHDGHANDDSEHNGHHGETGGSHDGGYVLFHGKGKAAKAKSSKGKAHKGGHGKGGSGKGSRHTSHDGKWEAGGGAWGSWPTASPKTPAPMAAPSSSTATPTLAPGPTKPPGPPSPPTPPSRTEYPTSFKPSLPTRPTPSPPRPPTPPTFPTYLPSASPAASTVPPPEDPPLVWLGVGGCTPRNPCPACHGDCDVDDDCAYPLECHKRSDDSTVPGCASGGEGDVPGADYCYDPVGGTPTTPTAAPVVGGSARPTPTTPTAAPVVGGSARPTMPGPSGSPSVLAPLPALTWRGVDGCTPSDPCPACAGDCDVDADCASDGNDSSGDDPSGGAAILACFKRADGSSDPVPGCRNGGPGDVPGADYCYDVRYAPTTSPTTSGGSGRPTRDAYFIRSQAWESDDDGDGGAASIARASPLAQGDLSDLRSLAPAGWCLSGALFPDYYQLITEACVPDDPSYEGAVVARMEQMDQLWAMDAEGYLRSVFDRSRCAMVPPSGVDTAAVAATEAPVEIGPCDDPNTLNRFTHDASASPSTLTLKKYPNLCVTFLGGDVANRGAPAYLSQCKNTAKYGWDFVAEGDLAERTPPPSPAPRLRYLGRDACTPEAPCPECTGDCDVDGDCQNGLRCFQRDRDDSTKVPRCAVGGPGDIPGADYCYDDGGGPTPPTPTPPTDPTNPAYPAPTPEPPLRWLGAEGCTATAPCQACEGDCDEDVDCLGDLVCHKRPVGGDGRVPGCAEGGMGDVPGGDYCSDPSATGASGFGFDEGPSRPSAADVNSRPRPPRPATMDERQVGLAPSAAPATAAPTSSSAPSGPTPPRPGVEATAAPTSSSAPSGPALPGMGGAATPMPTYRPTLPSGAAPGAEPGDPTEAPTPATTPGPPPSRPATPGPAPAEGGTAGGTAYPTLSPAAPTAPADEGTTVSPMAAPGASPRPPILAPVQIAPGESTLAPSAPVTSPQQPPGGPPPTAPAGTTVLPTYAPTPPPGRPSSMDGPPPTAPMGTTVLPTYAPAPPPGGPSQGLVEETTAAPSAAPAASGPAPEVTQTAAPAAKPSSSGDDGSGDGNGHHGGWGSWTSPPRPVASSGTSNGNNDASGHHHHHGTKPGKEGKAGKGAKATNIGQGHGHGSVETLAAAWGHGGTMVGIARARGHHHDKATTRGEREGEEQAEADAGAEAEVASAKEEDEDQARRHREDGKHEGSTRWDREHSDGEAGA
ncbi:hypothetical protein ACHAWF_015653 [Thalassiosira exigua]